MFRIFSNKAVVVKWSLVWLFCLIGIRSAQAQTLSRADNSSPCIKHIKIDRGTQSNNAQVVSFLVKRTGGGEESGSGEWAPNTRYYRIHTNSLDAGFTGSVTVYLTVDGDAKPSWTETFGSNCSPGGNSGTRMVADDSTNDKKRILGRLQATLQNGQEVRTDNQSVAASTCPASFKLDGSIVASTEFAGKTIYYMLTATTFRNGGTLTSNSPLPERFSVTFPEIAVRNRDNVVNARVGPANVPIATTMWTLKPTLAGLPATGWLTLRLFETSSGTTSFAVAQVRVQCGKITKSDLPVDIKAAVKSSDIK